MFISVIVPSYNSKNTIKPCLDSLENQNTESEYEIIVVDSSTDETPQIVEQFFPSVTLIRRSVRTLPGEARNIGIQNSSGNILAFTDADCTVKANWLSRIVKAHDSNFNVICGSVHNGYPDNIVSRAEFFSVSSEFLQRSPRRCVTVLDTCNFSCKREIFKDCGFFPNTIRAVDVIFSRQILENGCQILFEPSIEVCHFYRTRLKVLVQREISAGRAFSQISIHYQMKGSIIYKNRFLCLMYPFMKLPLVFYRVIRWDRTQLWHLFCTFPLIVIITFATTFGLLTAKQFSDCDTFHGIWPKQD